MSQTQQLRLGFKRSKQSHQLRQNHQQGKNQLSNRSQQFSKARTMPLEYIPKSYEQVVVINNRKFIKSRTPDSRSISPVPENSPFKQNSLHLQKESIKIKILQKRLQQIHASSQAEIFQLSNQNKRLKLQMSPIEQKSKCLIGSCSLFTPIKILNQADQANFANRDIKLQYMEKQILQLQQSLVNANQSKKQLENANQRLHRQLDEVKATVKSDKNIKFNAQVQSECHYQIANICQKEQVINCMSLEIQSLRQQVCILKSECKLKSSYILEKEELIQSITKRYMQSQILIRSLQNNQEQQRRQIEKLQLKIADLNLKTVKKQNELKALDQINIQIKNLHQYRSNQQFSDQEQLSPQIFDMCNQESLSNILQKIQILTSKNDSLATQKQLMTQQSTKLSETNEDLMKSLRIMREVLSSTYCLNQKALFTTKEGQKAQQIRLSRIQVQRQSQQCCKCAALTQAILLLQSRTDD